MSYPEIGLRIRSLREANCYTRDALQRKLIFRRNFCMRSRRAKRALPPKFCSEFPGRYVSAMTIY